MTTKDENIPSRGVVSVPAEEETAFAALVSLVGLERAEKFCRAFVRDRKVRISEAKFFVFANVVGATAAKRIIDVFAGELLTLPDGVSARERRARDAALSAAKGKIPQQTLAALTGLSRRQVIRIQRAGGGGGAVGGGKGARP